MEMPQSSQLPIVNWFILIALLIYHKFKRKSAPNIAPNHPLNVSHNLLQMTLIIYHYNSFDLYTLFCTLQKSFVIKQMANFLGESLKHQRWHFINFAVNLIEFVVGVCECV